MLRILLQKYTIINYIFSFHLQLSDIASTNRYFLAPSDSGDSIGYHGDDALEKLVCADIIHLLILWFQIGEGFHLGRLQLQFLILIQISNLVQVEVPEDFLTHKYGLLVFLVCLDVVK